VAMDDFYTNSSGLEVVTKYDSPMGAMYDKKLHFIMYTKNIHIMDKAIQLISLDILYSHDFLV
jgi:hypothetical protein